MLHKLLERFWAESFNLFSPCQNEHMYTWITMVIWLQNIYVEKALEVTFLLFMYLTSGPDQPFFHFPIPSPQRDVAEAAEV